VKLDASYILQVENARRNIIKKLEELRTVSTCPIEQEILDRRIEKEVAELNDWLELVVNTQQPYDINGMCI
jgi:CHASE3 domain sensor protein